MARKKNMQFCKRNHDTFITGRDSQNRCIECVKMNVKIYRETHREELLEYNRQWRILNAEKIQEKELACK
jgi:hypothetical protein